MDVQDQNEQATEDLIAGNPEAQKFVENVKSQLGRYRLYAGEPFLKVIGNVISGTGLDRQGESASIEELEALVSAVEDGAFYLRFQHDPLVHPIGRIIAARMFRAAELGKYFVVGVIGFYDAKQLPSFASKGIDISNLSGHGSNVTDIPEEPQAQIEFNPREIPEALVAEMLKTAPPSVALGEGVHFRKAVNPIAVLEISTSIFLLSNTPFGQKFQERLGEKVADASAAFLKWIAESVLVKIRQLTDTDTRLVISFQYKSCRVEFVLTGREGPNATTEAMEALEQASNQSLLLVDALESATPMRVTYGYDVTAKRWFPTHACTRNDGIITDQPYLIALENLQGGFSVGGRRLPLTTKNDSTSDQ